MRRIYFIGGVTTLAVLMAWQGTRLGGDTEVSEAAGSPLSEGPSLRATVKSPKNLAGPSTPNRLNSRLVAAWLQARADSPVDAEPGGPSWDLNGHDVATVLESDLLMVVDHCIEELSKNDGVGELSGTIVFELRFDVQGGSPVLDSVDYGAESRVLDPRLCHCLEEVLVGEPLHTRVLEVLEDRRFTLRVENLGEEVAR